MQDKNFIEMIFDLSFTEFVTAKIIKVVFMIGIIFSGIIALIVLIGGLSSGGGTAFLSIILSPVIFFLLVLFGRIWCEIVIVFFRIAENTSKMVDQGKS